MIRAICSRVVVMCQGQTVETGSVEQVLRTPQADYTKKLIAAIPDRGARLRGGRKGLA